MLISCEKCSTTYVLDDKLIPAQGAPVQCTRCSHVFLAKAPAAGSSAPAPMTNKTVMFGAPGSAAPATGGGGSGAGAMNKTVIFGGGGGGDAPAPAGGTSKTMMFGAAAGEPAPAPAPAPAGGASRTMMFGAAAPSAPAPAQQASNRTMMFGAPGSEAAASQPTNRTMMFGTPAAAGVSGPNAPGGALAGSPSKTMMFGVSSDGKVTAPPESPAPAAPAGTRNTMMFGAPGSQAPASGQAAAAQPKTSQTMMFGTPAAAPNAPAPAAQPKTSQTMMFGTPAAAPNAPAPAAPGGAGKTSQTMMFGAPAAAPAPAQQKTSSTMIFGAAQVPSASPGKAAKLSESTVRIGPDDIERMMREHDGGLTPPESAAVANDRRQKTQMFAMSDLRPSEETPPAGADSVPRHQKTQMFAMTPELAGEAPAPASPIAGRKTRQGAPRATEAGRAEPSSLDTFPPEARGASDDDDDQSQTVLASGGPAVVDPSNKIKTDPDLQSVDATAPRAELPPEAPALLQAPGLQGPTAPMQPVEGDPAAMLRAQVARRNRIAVIFVALVLLTAAVAVTWRVFGKLLLNKAPPAAAIEATEKALSTLRGDDTKSKEAAVAQLLEVTQKYPDYVEGHAGLVTAMTLQLDDVQQRVHRIEQLVDRKKMLVEQLKREHSPANWESTAQQLATQVDELIVEHKPLAELGSALDKKTREAYKGLESSVGRVGEPSRSAKLAALRAQALYHAVSGTDQAQMLLDRYEKALDGTPHDGWIDLTLPEYAANARVSKELMEKATAKIDELHKRDSTFLRTYVLSARLHLIRKENTEATDDLDKVLTLRKDHDVAAELREWVRKVPAQEKKDAPAPK